MRSLQIRSLFARLAFLVDNRGLRDFHKGMNVAKRSMVALSAVVAGGGLVVGKFVKEAAKLEQIKIAFTTMLGSADLAKETLDGLFKFARRTPFEIFGVLGTARILMGMGSSAQELLPQLKMVGDVASGLSVPLEQIALSFGKVQAAGYLTGYELQNLRRAGVPLVKTLSDMTGKGREVIQHLVRTRKISFEMFEEAFKRMTSAGGKFNNLMFEQSKTLLGIFVNIKDYVKEIVMFTGEETLPVMKQIARTALEWLKVNQQIIQQRVGNVLKKLIKYLADIVGIMLEVVRSFYLFSDILGGVENALKIMLITMSAIIGLGFATAIGYMTKALFSFTFALLTGQASLSLWPTLIGLAVIAAIVAFDSLYRYLTGWKGKTLAGWLDENFLGGNIKKGFDNLKGWIDDIIMMFNYLKDILSEHAKFLGALWDMWSGIATLNFGRFKRGFGSAMSSVKEWAKEKLSPGNIAEGLREAKLRKWIAKTSRNIIVDIVEFSGANAMFRQAGEDWKTQIPGMKAWFQDFLSFPGDVDKYIGQSFRETETNQRWGEILRPITIKIDQTLSGMTKEDAGMIADKTSQSLKEIIDYHSIVF